MTDRQDYNVTIPTRAHAILRETVETALTLGRMGIVRGPAGIGKSYALELIAEELSRGDDEVMVITASAATGGAVTKFFGKALLTLGILGNGAVDPMERFERFMLHSFPFRGYGPRKVLVVDECQHLKANVIECLRYIYDRGELARRFDADQPAFGLVLVGNGHFLTRGGNAERAAFEALLTRAAVEWELDRPPVEEIAALAQKLCRDQPDLQEAFKAFGAKCGNFRQPVEAVAIATHLAGEGPMTLTHLRRAFLLSGGDQ
jgi:DNA transposition AAA+ family ATPase